MSGTGFEVKEIYKAGPIYPVINRSRLFFVASMLIIMVLVVFLDKIITGLSQGLVFKTGLLFVGPYNLAALLGLIPILGIVTMGYFSRRTKLLADERYDGTFLEIRNRTIAYKESYLSSIRSLLIISLGILIATNALCSYLVSDPEIIRIIFTTSIASLLVNIIILNSMVLPIFGKIRIAKIAIFAVVIGTVLFSPFVANNMWYYSTGFLAGSLAGASISCISILSLFSNFEHNMFRFMLRSY